MTRQDTAAVMSTVTISADQAEQILHQLLICGDLLNDELVQTELRRTLTVCVFDAPADPDRFIGALGYSRRYLDARLASQRRRTAVTATRDLAEDDSAVSVDAGAA